MGTSVWLRPSKAKRDPGRGFTASVPLVFEWVIIQSPVHIVMFQRRTCMGMLKRTLLLALLIFFNGQFAAVEAVQPLHPLDPLSADEITLTVSILKSASKIGPESRFPCIALHEPTKEEVSGYVPGAPIRREAFAMVFDSSTGKVYEAVVDLTNKSVLSWKNVPGVQAPQLFEEYEMAPGIVRADPQWQEAIKKRGITDFENVVVEAWVPGYFGPDEWKGKRIFRCIFFYRGTGKNYYSRPIEGITAYYDPIQRKVLKVVDTGVVSVAKEVGEYDAQSVGRLREALKPLNIEQPYGTNFEIHGNEVRWQNWRFRFGMRPQEGLILYTVGYEDQGKVRSILYRASVSEMVVPYGDPDSNWSFRNAFDEGEYGLGHFVNSLVPAADASENATFVSTILNDCEGKPVIVDRAVAIYERDGGLLWKHSDGETAESRRARELVISWITTLGNYDYGFNWVFHQDGSLEMEILVTGLMLAKGVGTSSADHHAMQPYWHLVAPNVAAVNHQHFFSFRLDMDIDHASGNSVVEMNTKSVPPGPGNPRHNAFIMKETLFHKEQEAQRDVSLADSRKWKVINPSARNALGEPAGYLLLPGENSIPYAAPDSWVRKRGGFLNHHFWVTKYEPSEQHAAGDYVNQSKGGDGLVRWTSSNRLIENQDVVLWYTMGVTHIPRQEEWPVVSVHRTGFRLLPCGFFSRNPALDVPPPKVEPASEQ